MEPFFSDVMLLSTERKARQSNVLLMAKKDSVNFYSDLNWIHVNLLLATTSCIFPVNCCPSTVPEHLYLPASSNPTSFKPADLSQGSWEDSEDVEKEAGRRSGVGLKINPGFSFSQIELEGIKPGENTQGSVTADPTAAYTLVLSLDGWMIPVREREWTRRV